MYKNHLISARHRNSYAVNQTYSSILSALLAHWCNQDSLLWSRTQLLIAIQGAIIATSISEKFSDFGPLILAHLVSQLLYRL